MERVDYALYDAADPAWATTRNSYIHVWSTPGLLTTVSTEAEVVYTGYGSSTPSTCNETASTPALSVLQSFAGQALWSLFTDPTQAQQLTPTGATQPNLIDSVLCWPYTQTTATLQRTACFAVPGWAFFARNAASPLISLTDSVTNATTGAQVNYTVHVLAYSADPPPIGAFAPLWNTTLSPVCALGECASYLTTTLTPPTQTCISPPSPSPTISSTGAFPPSPSNSTPSSSSSSSTGSSFPAPSSPYDLSTSDKLALGLILGLFLPLFLCVAYCWCKRRASKLSSSLNAASNWGSRGGSRGGGGGGGRGMQRFDDDRNTLDLEEPPMSLTGGRGGVYDRGDEDVASVVRSLQKDRRGVRGDRGRGGAMEDEEEVKMEDVELSEDGESDWDERKGASSKKPRKKRATGGEGKGKRKKKKKKAARDDDEENAVEMGGI